MDGLTAHRPVANESGCVWESGNRSFEVDLILLSFILHLYFLSINRAVGPFRPLDLDDRTNCYWAVFLVDFRSGCHMNGRSANHPIPDKACGWQLLNRPGKFEILVASIVVDGAHRHSGSLVNKAIGSDDSQP